MGKYLLFLLLLGFCSLLYSNVYPGVGADQIQVEYVCRLLFGTKDVIRSCLTQVDEGLYDKATLQCCYVSVTEVFKCGLNCSSNAMNVSGVEINVYRITPSPDTEPRNNEKELSDPVVAVIVVCVTVGCLVFMACCTIAIVSSPARRSMASSVQRSSTRGEQYDEETNQVPSYESVQRTQPPEITDSTPNDILLETSNTPHVTREQLLTSEELSPPSYTEVMLDQTNRYGQGTTPPLPTKYPD